MRMQFNEIMTHQAFQVAKLYVHYRTIIITTFHSWGSRSRKCSLHNTRQLLTQEARRGGFSTPLEDDGLLAIWAFSPLSCPDEAVAELLADLQTSRPTATVALHVGPMVGQIHREW